MPDPDAHVTTPTYGLGAREITFRPVTHGDFALLHRWLVTPEVQAWWRSQTRTVGDVEREYGPQVDGADPTRSFVIQAGDTPVGMIQCYRHADYPEWDQAAGVPSAAGIDYLIGPGPPSRPWRRLRGDRRVHGHRVRPLPGRRCDRVGVSAEGQPRVLPGPGEGGIRLAVRTRAGNRRPV